MKRITRDQFIQATSSLTMGESTLEIAEGVLVDGKSQADYARAKQITRGAVSQIVSRVWKIHLNAKIKDKPQSNLDVSAFSDPSTRHADRSSGHSQKRTA